MTALRRVLPIIAALMLSGVGAASGAANCHGVVNLPLTRWEGDVGELVDGFCVDGYRFERLLSEYFWRNTVLPTHTVTRFLYQQRGLIDLTAALRGLELNGAAYFVAVYPASVVGYKVWLRPDAHSEWVLARVADTAAQYHAQYHVEILKSGVELSWELAERWGVPEMNSDPRGRYLWNAEMCFTETDPNGVCAGEATDLVTWFVQNARYE